MPRTTEELRKDAEEIATLLDKTNFEGKIINVEISEVTYDWFSKIFSEVPSSSEVDIFSKAPDMAYLIAELSAKLHKLHLSDCDNSELEFELESERTTNIGNEAENKYLAAKLREREEVLDHIHHVAAGAHDSDKDKTLLSIISEASKPTPPENIKQRVEFILTRDVRLLTSDEVIIKELNERVAELSARLREREWKDISTAPKDGEAVIVVDGKGDLYTACNSGDAWESVCLGDINTDYPDPTKWQPLPTPPKEN